MKFQVQTREDETRILKFNRYKKPSPEKRKEQSPPDKGGLEGFHKTVINSSLNKTTMTKKPLTKKTLEKPKGQVLIYQAEEGQTRLEVRLEGETVWLTQKAIAELYQTSVPNINIHIQNIYSEGELRPEATIKDFLIVQK